MGTRTANTIWCLTMAGVLMACPAEPTDDGPDATTTDDPAPTTAATPPAENTGGTTTPTPPGDDTTTSPTSGPGTDDDDGPDTDGPPKLDLGGIPDMPGGELDCQQAVDIVFTMDVSTTMGGFINLLADEILAVDAAIAALELPFEPHYGLAVFVDDALLVNGGVPYTDANDLRNDFLMWAAFTAGNQQVGGGNSNGTFTENSLDAIYFAADGFQWRPADSTIRMIIHTTDDTFWDGPTMGNGVMIQHGYGETVQRMQDQQVRGYMFTDDLGTPCNCADVTMGWSSPYMGMLPIPEATDGAYSNINDILSGMVSLADAINAAVEESYCDPYTPVG